jgi:hypothetical protein
MIAGLYDQHVPRRPALRAETWPAAVGALNEVVVAHLRSHGVERLVELEDALVEIQVALFSAPHADGLVPTRQAT